MAQQNPFQVLQKTYETFVQCIQIHLPRFVVGHKHETVADIHQNPPKQPLFSISSKPKIVPSDADSAMLPSQHDASVSHPVPFTKFQGQPAKPFSKEELGRATWTLLHTLAAQFPENPTRQQKRDAKELMAILSRLYPCKECADHFKEILKANPVQAGSQAEFSQWLCHVHNVVNRSLGKVVFPCHRVDARWGKLECQNRACDLEGTTTKYMTINVRQT